MDETSKAQQAVRCPCCGGSFRHSEPHQCDRKSQADEGSNKPVPSQEKISKRAYELYVARGEIPGHDVDDWLQAERELCVAGRHHS